MEDPYTLFGLDPGCTTAQIRAAYRKLSKRWHPDLNGDSPEALAHTRALNAAYELIGDPEQRAEYDRACRIAEPTPRVIHGMERNLTQDVWLRVEDFLRGTRLTVRVKDPANPHGEEIYELEVPEETAPGTRFRIPREAPFEGCFLSVRVRPAPGRFKARGSDLRCDLRISAARASAGGCETIPGPDGGMVRLDIPSGVARGVVLKVAGRGLPKARGGRGDLLVRVQYRPEVSVTRGGPQRSGLRRLG